MLKQTETLAQKIEDTRHLAKEKMATLTTLLKDRVKVLTEELYTIERQMVSKFQLPMYCTLNATTLRRHLHDCELDLQDDIVQMEDDLELVQDDTRFKRWLLQQQQASIDEFDYPF